METYVLIPPELSLVPMSRDQQADSRKVRSWHQEHAGPRVWSNQRLPRGKRFLPFEGTVRLDKLDVFAYLDDDDIRHCFGSYDEIQDTSRWKTRQCNWVRFLRYSTAFNGEVNLLGTLVKGEPVYETLRTVPPDTELVVYFEDPEGIKRNRGSGGEAGTFEWSTGIEWLRNRHFVIAQYRHTMGIILEATPLDLSQSLLNSRVKAQKNEVFPVLYTPTSITRTTDSLDDRLSLSTESFKKSSMKSYSDVPTCLTPKRGKERTLLPCEVCGKAFDRPSLLRRHMRTHTGEKPHVCEVCGKGFSTSSSLNTHRRIHSGEKPHQCHVCGKRFTASSNLYYHRMTHSKEKPHKCSLCAKSFPTPGDLKSHMYVHNGSWPFKCHICSRGFSKQTNLKNHLFLHTGDKPHVCSYCQKRFALACNLRAHLKTHEGEQLDQCTKCFKSYPLAAGVLVHGYCHDCYQTSNGISLTKKDTSEDVSEAVKSEYCAKVSEKETFRKGELKTVSKNDHFLEKMDQQQGQEVEEVEDDEEEDEQEEDDEEETRRHFVLGVLDQVMLRYEQAGALIAKSLELSRLNGNEKQIEQGIALSTNS